MNSEILLADCLDVYNVIGEGPQVTSYKNFVNKLA